jgi:SNF2 family DNA or RNA helicase
LALTGSPLDGYISSLASVLSFLYGENNELFPYRVETFDKLFSQTIQVNQDYKTGKATGKLRKLPGVKASKLSLYFHSTKHLIHRLTTQNEIVSKYVKYPTEIKQRIKVNLTLEHGRLYRNAIFSRENLMKLVKQLDNNELDLDKPGINRAIAIRELDYLKQIVNCPWNVIDDKKISIDIEDISKAHLCKSIVEKHLALNHKGIIFIHHVAVGSKLKQFLEDQLKIKIARIYAIDKYSKPTEMSLDDRERQIIEFQNDPDIKLLITNTELCSEGLNLVEATYGIFYDYGWRSVIIEQASKRYARPGQLSPEVYTYYLEANNTVDTLSLIHI